MRKKILLQTCCGPCALYVISWLQKEYDVTVYFYNPNIHPFQEYGKRKNQIEQYCTKNNIDFAEADYEIGKWEQAVKGFEKEPEKGARCAICFKLRLESAVKFAADNSFDLFATTLTISPHKDFKLISDIGIKLAKNYKIEFSDIDWKKKNGFTISMRMAREREFYIQNYCGCRFSIEYRGARNEERVGTDQFGRRIA